VLPEVPRRVSSDESQPAAGSPGAADQAYFLAVEDIFVRLRGAPLLLSPADWQAARRWHRQGVPLEVVREALEEVFARRRERGAKGRISSLRYCGPAVEAAWERHSDLAAHGERAPAEAFDAAGRLRRLAAALPPNLPGVAALRARLEGLMPRPPAAGRRVPASESPEAVAGELATPASAEAVVGEVATAESVKAAQEKMTVLESQEAGDERAADPQAIEERLADLDREVLDGAWAALGEAERESVEARVAATLASLASRLPADEVEAARARLARQVLRQSLGLPVLSLFSPEALNAAEEGDAQPLGGPPAPVAGKPPGGGRGAPGEP
jgi:hypothetical protein